MLFTVEPWLGVNSNYTRINVESQLDDPNSIRSMYKAMIAFRAGSETLKAGSFEALKIKKDLFAYRRSHAGESLAVILNFSPRERSLPWAGARLALSNYEREDYDGVLQPYEAVILKES